MRRVCLRPKAETTSSRSVSAVVTINDQPVLTIEPYCPRQTLDVTQYLRRGKNEIVVAARPIEGPAAVAVSLTIRGNDGEPITIISDETWSGAASRGPVPPEQSGTITADLS